MNRGFKSSRLISQLFLAYVPVFSVCSKWRSTSSSACSRSSTPPAPYALSLLPAPLLLLLVAPPPAHSFGPSSLSPVPSPQARPLSSLSRHSLRDSLVMRPSLRPAAAFSRLPLCTCPSLCDRDEPMSHARGPPRLPLSLLALSTKPPLPFAASLTHCLPNAPTRLIEAEAHQCRASTVEYA